MVEQIKGIVSKVVSDNGENSFVQRSLFSSEFLLIVIYIALVYANGAYSLGVSEASMGRIENLVFIWSGIRQIGKAVSYQAVNKNGGETR